MHSAKLEWLHWGIDREFPHVSLRASLNLCTLSLSFSFTVFHAFCRMFAGMVLHMLWDADSHSQSNPNSLGHLWGKMEEPPAPWWLDCAYAWHIPNKSHKQAAQECLELLLYMCTVFVHFLIGTSNLQRSWGAEVSKKKETIGRSDALLIFAPHTRVLHLSAISLNERIPPIKLALSFSKNLYFWWLFSRSLLFSALFSRNLYFWVLFSRNLFWRRN